MAGSPLQPLFFGPLPVETINPTLDLELDTGSVVLSINAQKHASKRHPKEYGRCLPVVANVIAYPLYLGDDLKNPGKIELVGRPPALGSPLLVAVDMAPDADGNYNVVSFYPISEAKVQNRRDKGHLLPCVRPKKQEAPNGAPYETRR